MSELFYVLITIFLLFNHSHTAVGHSGLPSVQLQIEFDQDSKIPRILKGKMEISNILPNEEKRICFYLPYQDPEYGATRGDMHRFEMLTSNHRKPSFRGGSQYIIKTKPATLQLSPSKELIVLELPRGWNETESIEINFSSQVPRLDRSLSNEWIYDGYFPQLLNKCPSGSHLYLENASKTPANYKVTINVPDDWSYLGLGENNGGLVQFQGPMPPPNFMLVKGFKKTSGIIAGVPVTISYQSESFLHLKPSLEVTLNEMAEIFGSFPFESLTLVESSELHRHGAPGLISINRPPQLIFDKVQKDLLNWQHWILTLQLSKQWAGSLVSTLTTDDEWILSGIGEYATIQALKKNLSRFDLFNDSAWGKKILTFNYLQQTEILTSMLKKNSPYAILTDNDMNTALPHHQQDKLLFLRQVSAIRQVETIVGTAKLNSFLRTFFADYAFRPIKPIDFINHFKRLPSPFSEIQRSEISDYFKSWWTLNGWPDFRIRDIEHKKLPNGYTSIEVKVEQIGGIDHPPLVSVMGENGRLYSQLARKESEENSWVSRFLLNSSLSWVTIDPEHRYFDSDRFNNSTKPPNLFFFPGSANTLADDSYTLIWIPYPFRRPGESFSIGIQGGILKYVQGAVTTNIEYSPSSKKNAYLINYNYQWDNKSFANGITIQKKQDNNREIELNFTDQNIAKTSNPISFSGVLKRKDQVGQEKSKHGSYGLKLGFKPSNNERTCILNSLGSYEKAPLAWSRGFSYERNFISLIADCRISHQFVFFTKAFVGKMSGEGILPDSAFFKPNELNEAKLRIDQSLGRVKGIQSISNDLSMPMHLPLPFDFLILSRQLRWRLFYDVGYAPHENISYRSGGIGFQLPIGGDLSGAGSLAFTKLTFLTVLHSQVGNKTIKKPSILFDFTGQL